MQERINSFESAVSKIASRISRDQYLRKLLDWADLIVGKEGKDINKKIQSDLIEDNTSWRKKNFNKILLSEHFTEKVDKLKAIMENGEVDVLDIEGFYKILTQKEFNPADSREIMNNWLDVVHGLARLDQMSGLYNRRAFYEDLRAKIHEPEGRFFLCYIDVDFFKVYNEISHLFGDLGIKNIASSVISCVMSEYSGLAKGYRYGGEELFVEVDYQPGKIDTPSEAQEFAIKLKKEIKDNLDSWVMDYERDKFEGRPVIRDFLRKKILGEKFKDVNEQFKNNGKLESVKRKIKARGFERYIPNINSLDAVDLIIKIDELLKGSKLGDDRGYFESWIKDADGLLVEAGTVSIGVLPVDCREAAQENLMSDKDKALVLRWVGNKDMRGYIDKDFFEDIIGGNFSDKNISYDSLYLKLISKVRELKKQVAGSRDQDEIKKNNGLILALENLIKVVDNSRIGRLAGVAARIIEKAKHTDRNVVKGVKGVLRDKDINQAGFVELAKLDLGREEEQTNEVFMAVKRIIKTKLDKHYRDVENRKFKSFNIDRLGSDNAKALLFQKLDGREETQRYLCNLIEVPEVEIFLKLLLNGEYEPDEVEDKIKDFFIFQQGKYRESLTGAYNEQYMVDVLGRQMQEFARQGKAWTVCSFDFDNLKPVNEAKNCSHDLGDIVIMETIYLIEQKIDDDEWVWRTAGLDSAQDYLKRMQGNKPTVVRITGGEEFVISFPGLNSQQVKLIQDRLNQDIVHPKIQKILAGEYFEEGLAESRLANVNADIFAYMDQHYPHRNQTEKRNKIGSLTAGIIDVQEWAELNKLDPKQINKTHIREMRLMADKLGELGKNLPKDAVLKVDSNCFYFNYKIEEFESYRGESINFVKLKKIVDALKPWYNYFGLHTKVIEFGREHDLIKKFEPSDLYMLSQKGWKQLSETYRGRFNQKFLLPVQLNLKKLQQAGFRVLDFYDEKLAL